MFLCYTISCFIVIIALFSSIEDLFIADFFSSLISSAPYTFRFTDSPPVSMFAPCINSTKALFIIPTDAHNYKNIGILKQLKFRQLLRHVSFHAGTIISELFRA